MSEFAQDLFMALGAALIVVGVLMLVFRPSSGDIAVKLFGQEVRISAPGLVVIVLGCVMFAAPFLIPLRPSAAPQPKQEASIAAVVPKPDVPTTPSTTQAETIAPTIEAPPPSEPKPQPPPFHTRPAAPPPAEASTKEASPPDAGPGTTTPADETEPALPPAQASYPPRCKSGYVWRVARPTDFVCVPPESRARAAQQNAQAASHVDPAGAYGPATCMSGYVWREAYMGDVVCVVPRMRAVARVENQMGPGRTGP